MSSAALQIIGAGLEVIGFGVVTVDLVRLRAETFGGLNLGTRLREWARFVWHGPPVEAEAKATSTVTASLNLEWSVDGPPDLATLEDRVARLEELAPVMAQRLQQVAQTAATDTETLRGELKTHAEEAAKREAERAARERQVTGPRIGLQLTGTALFALGTIVGLVGNLT